MNKETPTTKEAMAVSSEVTTGANAPVPQASTMSDSVEGLVTPLEFDVLCSKDKTHSTHAGNRLFRERIDAMKEIYRMTKNKQGKMEITKNIVNYLKQTHSTRFLKRSANGSWAEISDQAARDKVSHALRFATRRDNAGNIKRNKGPSQPQGPSSGVDPINPQRPAASRTTSEATTSSAVSQDSAASAAAAGDASGSVYYGRRIIPVEHIEPSKWLLALRQGP